MNESERDRHMILTKFSFLPVSKRYMEENRWWQINERKGGREEREGREGRERREGGRKVHDK